MFKALHYMWDFDMFLITISGILIGMAIGIACSTLIVNRKKRFITVSILCLVGIIYPIIQIIQDL